MQVLKDSFSSFANLISIINLYIKKKIRFTDFGGIFYIHWISQQAVLDILYMVWCKILFIGVIDPRRYCFCDINQNKFQIDDRILYIF